MGNKKSNPRSFRTSISLTEDLKSRMRKMAEGEVNWSDVVGRAIEAELLRIAYLKRETCDGRGYLACHIWTSCIWFGSG